MTMIDTDRLDLGSQAAALPPRMPSWRNFAVFFGIVLVTTLMLPWWWNSNNGFSAFDKMAAMSQQEQEELAVRQERANEYIQSKKDWLESHKDTLDAKLKSMNDGNVDIMSGFTLRLMGWDVWQGIATCGMGVAMAVLVLGLSAFRPQNASPVWLCLAGIGLSIAALGVTVCCWWWQVPKFNLEPIGGMGVGTGVYVASAGAVGGLVSCTIGLLVRRRKQEGSCEATHTEAAPRP